MRQPLIVPSLSISGTLRVSQSSGLPSTRRRNSAADASSAGGHVDWSWLLIGGGQSAIQPSALYARAK